jgi:hypothetical protein
VQTKFWGMRYMVLAEWERGNPMHTVIKADDGDLVIVHADDLSIEQLTIRLELESPAYGGTDFDQLTLSTRCARELGRVLIQAADLVELNARRLCGSQHFDFIACDPTRSPRCAGSA